jgi:hypothetical protein
MASLKLHTKSHGCQKISYRAVTTINFSVSETIENPTAVNWGLTQARQQSSFRYEARLRIKANRIGGTMAAPIKGALRDFDSRLHVRSGPLAPSISCLHFSTGLASRGTKGCRSQLLFALVP